MFFGVQLCAQLAYVVEFYAYFKKNSFQNLQIVVI